ncbi:MAG: exopolyphosphatase, partial [Pseudomonadota bacterium]
GLAIAHAGYHKHGGYLLEHSDLPGFSVQEQQVLANLVRTHRRKPDSQTFNDLPKSVQEIATKLTILLRLAVKLQRSRLHDALPDLKLKAKPRQLKLIFPSEWLKQHDLTRADLEREISHLQLLDYELKIESQ